MADDLKLEFDDADLKAKLNSALVEHPKATFFYRSRNSGSGIGTHGKTRLLKDGQYKVTLRSDENLSRYSRDVLVDTVVKLWTDDLLNTQEWESTPRTFDNIRSPRGNLPYYVGVKFG